MIKSKKMKQWLDKVLICTLVLVTFTLCSFLFLGCNEENDTSDEEYTTGLAGVIYVAADNDSGAEDGQSWSGAYTTLTAALESAKSGEDIWVAQGTYYPTADSNRDISFNLVSGVAVFGGFKGTESAFLDRDWQGNETILSGDIGALNEPSDNVYHVVVGADGATLDGFTIVDGNADFPNDGSGCLIETDDTDAEILRIVTDIKSSAGGGLLNIHASTVTRNCTFRNNAASKGGAVYNMVTQTWNSGEDSVIGDSPWFENCVFEENSATGRGGAVNSDFFTTPTYVNCQFKDNHCDAKGGAVYNDMGSPSYFINVLFAENSAERGAALVADGSSSHRLVYCTFVNNTAYDLGAALYQGTYMGEMETGFDFRGNEVHLYNSLVVGNSSESAPSSISNWHDDSASFDDSSLIETVDGTYVLSAYVDMTTYATLDADRGWQPDREVDSDAWLATFGADANATYKNHSYDTSIVAGYSTVFYVNGAADGDGDGASWATAYNDLQDALDLADSGSQIWIAAGTYRPTQGTNRETAFVIKEGVEIYGGFDGATDDSLDDRDVVNNITILSGDIGMVNDMADNSYHVLFAGSDAVIDGVTIQEGRADGVWFNSRGGGLLCYDGNSPLVNDCVFTSNYAVEGGAIAAFNSSAPIITNCTIESNTAQRGAGILFRTGPDTQETGAWVEGSTFKGNAASDRGGAVYIDYGAWPSFSNCDFSLNTAVGNGGAVYVDNNSSQLSVINTWFDECEFQSNISWNRGGGFSVYEGRVHLSSSTLTDNSAETGGGGIALDYQGSYDAEDTIISGNVSTIGDGDVDDKATPMLLPPPFDGVVE